jgi:hypothetical protein
MRGIQQPEYRGCAEMLYEVGFRHECQAADSGVNAIGPQWLALIRDLVAGELTQLYIAGEVPSPVGTTSSACDSAASCVDPVATINNGIRDSSRVERICHAKAVRPARN